MRLFDKVKTAFSSKQSGLQLKPLKNTDLPEVLIIEGRVYDFPWSEQIFKDCLAMNYSSWGLMHEGELIGYAILSIAVGEAHVLNICINPNKQGLGFGGHFLQQLFKVAKGKKAERMFLEVRPSNTRAVGLYEKLGFAQIGQRKNYYPAGDGREDALVYSIDLNPTVI
tara:strand:+ start:9458 stop:9961 length:504 start_codon:yes stop_codon:yes gene_type:complete